MYIHLKNSCMTNRIAIVKVFPSIEYHCTMIALQFITIVYNMCIYYFRKCLIGLRKDKKTRRPKTPDRMATGAAAEMMATGAAEIMAT